jgi:hypothetical protein
VQHLPMAPQAIILLSQQAADRRGTGPAVHCLRQATQPRPNPLLPGTRIAGGLWFYQLSRVFQQRGIFFSTRGRPPPGSRTRSVGRP